jgi:predicted secreted protein
MKRTKKFAFVSFCLLSQAVRAEGLVRKYPAVVEPVINLLIQHHVNIIQMPCPELLFDSFHRKPCGKGKYENSNNRNICHGLACQILNQIRMLIKNGQKIEMILGIDFSPSCAVHRLMGYKPRKPISGTGIYIEELTRLIKQENIRIPIVGVSTYSIENTINEIQSILSGG